ncbi:MAG: hypothetical protein QW717_03620 [Candidatus Bathyarchaeia archaeon]
MARKQTLDGLRQDEEHCMNPWNGKCGNTDILLYICHGGEKLPICLKCWVEICDSELEWEETGRVKHV